MGSPIQQKMFEIAGRSRCGRGSKDAPFLHAFRLAGTRMFQYAIGRPCPSLPQDAAGQESVSGERRAFAGQQVVGPASAFRVSFADRSVGTTVRGIASPESIGRRAGKRERRGQDHTLRRVWRHPEAGWAARSGNGTASRQSNPGETRLTARDPAPVNPGGPDQQGPP